MLNFFLRIKQMSLRWMNEDHTFTLNQNADDKRHKKFLHSVHVFRCCVSKHTSDPDQRFTGFPWLEGITYILMSSMVISSFVTRLFFIIIIEVRLNVVENTLNDFISEKKVYLRLRFFFSQPVCTIDMVLNFIIWKFRITCTLLPGEICMLE